MYSRNGSLLAFNAGTSRSAAATIPQKDATPGPANGTGHAPLEARSLPSRAVVQPHVDCPRCELSISLSGMQVALNGNGAGAPETDELEKQLEALETGRSDYKTVLNAIERDLLGRALERNNGVMKYAARALGLKYTTFVAKAHRLGLIAER